MVTPNTVRNAVNRAIQGSLGALLALIGFGDLLRQDMKQEVRGLVPALNANQIGTLHQVTLPNIAKGCVILRAWARTGGVTGELIIDKYGTTPITGHIAVAPNGDLVTLAADAITLLDIWYLPQAGEEVTLKLTVAAHQAAIPKAYSDRGILYLISSNAIVGGSTGVKIVKLAGTAPAAGASAVSIDSTNVKFNAADAVTECTLTFLVARPTSLANMLDAQSSII